MALVSRMMSDITGAEAPEGDFVTLVIREHPSTSEPKSLDVLPSEVSGLSEAKNLVVIELKTNGDTRQLVVPLADFRKVVSDEVVQAGRSTRGRRPGTRLNGS